MWLLACRKTEEKDVMLLKHDLLGRIKVICESPLEYSNLFWWGGGVGLALFFY